MTIVEAIKTVMRMHATPMTYLEVYKAIVEAKLYEFHAEDPAHVVRAQIRRHCEGVDISSRSSTMHFRLLDGNRYVPLDKPRKVTSRPARRRGSTVSSNRLSEIREELEALHNRYLAVLKQKLLSELKLLSPGDFEGFAKRLMDAYGFEAAKVTQISRDGGIDGHGKLKVGLAYLNVAFQCKRWLKGNIQRPEVDKFRGAIQGEFEQGIFFTTASFSDGAIGASVKRGAVPVVLIDGMSIVTLMIEKHFGIESTNLFVPTYALDLAIGSDASGGTQGVSQI